MLLAVSALAALVLLLLVLRLTQRLTLRVKLLAGVSLSRQPEKSCPHLGLASDPFAHGSQPADDHRCYLWMQRDRIDLAHQKGFCLSTAHRRCPWLMIRRPDAPPPLRKRLPRAAAGLPRATWRGVRAVPVLVASAFTGRDPRQAESHQAAPAVGATVLRHPERRAKGLLVGAGVGLRMLRSTLSMTKAACAQAAHAAAARLQAAAPRLGGAIVRAGQGSLVVAVWFGRMLRGAILLLATVLCWLLPRLVRGFGWLLSRLSRRLAWLLSALLSGLASTARWLAQALAARREERAARLAASKAATAQAASAQLAGEAARAQAGAPSVTAALASTLLAEPAAVEPEASPASIAEPVGPPSLARLEELLAEGLATLDRGQESLAYHIFAKATEQRVPRGAAEAYGDVFKRAWFWRAKTAETIEEVVLSLEKALEYEPGNLQMQAHLAWAHQRLERERKLQPIEQATPPPAAAPAPPSTPGAWRVLGTGVRMAGGLMALAFAALWMTTAVMPALGRVLGQLPAGDELLLRRLILSLNAAALPGQGHLPLPVVNYDLGLSLPFVMAFAFVFTARGLMDGDGWARTTGLFFAAVGGWLCAAAVTNADASRLGLALCVGIIVAAVAGRFESPRRMSPDWAGY